jgi:hypothetical protein
LRSKIRKRPALLRCKGAGKIRINIWNVNSVPPAAQSLRLSAERRAMPWVKGRHEERLPYPLDWVRLRDRYEAAQSRWLWKSRRGSLAAFNT